MSRLRETVCHRFREARRRNTRDDMSDISRSDSGSGDKYYAALEYINPPLAEFSNSAEFSNPVERSDSGYTTAIDDSAGEGCALTRYGSRPHAIIPELPRPWIAGFRPDSGVSGMSITSARDLTQANHGRQPTNNSTQSLATSSNGFNHNSQGRQPCILQHAEELTANTELPSTSRIREEFLRTSHINLPTTEGLRRSKTSPNTERRRNNSYTQGYSIDDASQGYKELEEEHKKRVDAILDGHLDKLFQVDFPATVHKVSASRTAQAVRPRAGTLVGQEAVVVEEKEEEETGYLSKMKQTIGGKWRAGVRRLKGIRETRETLETPKPRGRAKTRRFTIS